MYNIYREINRVTSGQYVCLYPPLSILHSPSLPPTGPPLSLALSPSLPPSHPPHLPTTIRAIVVRGFFCRWPGGFFCHWPAHHHSRPPTRWRPQTRFSTPYPMYKKSQVPHHCQSVGIGW